MSDQVRVTECLFILNPLGEKTRLNLANETNTSSVYAGLWSVMPLQNHQGVNVMQEIADRLNAVNHLNSINAVPFLLTCTRPLTRPCCVNFQPNTEFTLFSDLMPLSRSVRINPDRV